MKKAINILLLVLIISGCKKKDDSVTLYPSSLEPPFSMEINGVDITCDNHHAYGKLVIDTSSSPGNTDRHFLIIAGWDLAKTIEAGFWDSVNSDNLLIKSYPDTIANIYPWIGYADPNDTVSNYVQLWQMTHFSISAIDNTNKIVSGTFSGILVDTLANDTMFVSQGAFRNMHYVIYWI